MKHSHPVGNLIVLLTFRYDTYPGGCGHYDDDDFIANDMCCACEGGTMKGKTSEGSVEIIVPCVVGGVLLLGGIAILMRRRVLKALQHRRSSMPVISSKALDIPAPGDE